jgi:hypothetical protein
MALPTQVIFLVLATSSGDIELTSLPCQPGGYIALAPTSIECYHQQEGRVRIPSLSIDRPASEIETILGQCSYDTEEFVYQSRPLKLPWLPMPSATQPHSLARYYFRQFCTLPPVEQGPAEQLWPHQTAG